MTAQIFKQWLISQQGNLDSIIANAGRAYWTTHRGLSNFAYDLNECQHESYNLIRQKDLCYDRPNTAFAYSLWYHARRVNTFLSHFGTRMLEASAANINVFDMGAGTGAVQWSVGLLVAFLKLHEKTPPNFRLINVDISPLMMEYNRDYLWPEFVKVYPQVPSAIRSEYECNSWMNTAGNLLGENWLSASYLFDISDADADKDSNYSTAVQENFKDLVNSFKPTRALLLTSNQTKKVELMNKVVSEISSSGYMAEHVGASPLWLSGRLPDTSAFRQELFLAHRESLLGTEGMALQNATSWSDGSFISCAVAKQQQALLPSAVSQKLERDGVSLFNPPIKVRREVKLNPEQTKAAKHSNRHTIITGPAGCGKSVVITERIKNLVEEERYSSNLKILVSTFNKPLIAYLRTWVIDLLDPAKLRQEAEHLYFPNSAHPNVSFRHFDILPPRNGGLRGDLLFDYDLRHYAANAILEIKAENRITHNRFDVILNPVYIVEEYHRIIYGLQYVKETEFMVSERRGRVPRLRYNSESRRLLWHVCMRFLDKLEKSPFDSIVTRRHKFLKMLKAEVLKPQYTHVFIDEYQDCTQADYQIFDRLLIQRENLVMAGDFAQSVNLGATATLPRLDTHIGMGRRDIVRLKGSYRLPYRISEAISPLSEVMKDGNIITPFKAAPPGARPIVLYAENQMDLAAKMRVAHNRYKAYGANHVTILEKDPAACTALRNVGISTDSDTVLRLKGMEKPFVLWSTRADIEHPDEVPEFIYTILSRTSGVLVIALFPTLLPKYDYVLRHLNPDRLIFRDKMSEEMFHRFKDRGDERGPIELDE